MKINIKKAFPLFFGIAIWVFFAFIYKYHILYIEKMQMFLFTKEYFIATVGHPGGFGDYISRFLIQFYYYPAVGSAILALLLCSLQKEIFVFCKNINGKDSLYPLTFIPSFFYWALMCNENFTMAGLIGLICAVWIVNIYLKNKKGNAAFRGLISFLIIPVIWLLFGGTAIITFALILIAEFSIKKKHNIIVSSLAVISVIITIILAPYVSPQVTNSDMFIGGNYYKYTDTPLSMFVWLWTSVVAVILIVKYIPNFNKKWISIVLTVAVICLGVCFIAKEYNKESENIMFYIDHVRSRDWKGIIKHKITDKKPSPLFTNSINLALAMSKNEEGVSLIGESAFKYYQNGLMSLISKPEDDWVISSEILYNLGFINEAQRYVFEAMVITPDNQTGTFFITRLAETNLIAGRRKVADKYLHILENTLFYHYWAKERLKMSEDDIDSNPIYGHLRKMQPKTDFLFNPEEFVRMLKIIFIQHPDNDLVKDYLLMAFLLDNNLNDFASLIDSQKIIPHQYQEALALLYEINSIPSENRFIKVEESITKEVNHFIEMYGKNAGNASVLAKYFWGTYCFYYTFRY
ncbi:MAG: DUF6057 family protein [Bacteroidales bacterium]|nr:DUF6057 family protein [Bacteroidales bacterium]